MAVERSVAREGKALLVGGAPLAPLRRDKGAFAFSCFQVREVASCCSHKR